MPSCDLIESARGIVADTSALINLIASGNAREIAQALPVPLRVARTVVLELEGGCPRWTTNQHLMDLEASGVVAIVDLDSAAVARFEELVVGPASETLDDGEAATIACALTSDLMALIDERKAGRICRERFPSLTVATTVDVLLSRVTERTLGAAGVAEALFHALVRGRMRVPAFQMERVVEILGVERAALCSSLPTHVRTLFQGTRVPRRY